MEGETVSIKFDFQIKVDQGKIQRIYKSQLSKRMEKKDASKLSLSVFSGLERVNSYLSIPEIVFPSS